MIAIIVSTLANISDLQAFTFEDAKKKELVQKHRDIGSSDLVIPPSYFKHIQDWVHWAKKEFNVNNTTPLFFNPLSPDRALSRHSIWKIISSAIKESCSCKSTHEQSMGAAVQYLRVSAAQKLFSEGCDTGVLTKLAGVENFESFAHLTPTLMKKREEHVL